MRNPFTPSFGTSPPILAGRAEIIEEFCSGLDDGPGAASRATLYTGARGSGKTVMLNEIEAEARKRGWKTVSETASRGMVERLTHSRLPALVREFDPGEVKRRLSRINLPVVGGGVTWETIESTVVKIDLRAQVELLTDLLAETESGILITVDEIHAVNNQEMRDLATVVQHAFREERELAFAAAGLQSSVSEILQDDVLTFLRRAERHHLGPVELKDVRAALEEPIRDQGKTVSSAALDLMVEGTRGYPFLIQLVGSSCWRESREKPEIGTDEARQGVSKAHKRLGALVHEPSLKGASNVDRSFLLAMAVDDGPSRTADIAERLGETIKYAGVYRARLIDMEIIEATKRGYVDFALPYLRDYLREHAASEIPGWSAGGTKD